MKASNVILGPNHVSSLRMAPVVEKTANSGEGSDASFMTAYGGRSFLPRKNWRVKASKRRLTMSTHSGIQLFNCSGYFPDLERAMVSTI